MIRSSTLPKNSLVMHLLGRFLARLTGWTVVGSLPDVNRAVIIAAPHTSNWDGFYMLVVSAVLRVRVAWVIKHSAYVWPLSWLLWAFGAIPIDRRNPETIVETLARRIRAQPTIALAVSPPGSRSLGKYWKSGFYRIAQSADVPIICTYLDYARKQGGIGPIFEPSGDMHKDMEVVRRFYNEVSARNPELKTPVRLREEQQLND